MSLLPIYDFDRPFRLMDRPFLRFEDFYNPYSMVPRPFERQELRPWEYAMKSMNQLVNAMSKLGFEDNGSSISGDSEKFHINVDVQHFRPEEITVKVVDGQVLVEGKHEEQRDEHGYVSRWFVRKYALPHGCLPDTVKSTLSSDGVLTVTAPKVLPMPCSGEKIIPITHTGPVQRQVSSSADGNDN